MAYYFRKKYNRQDKTFPEIRIYELATLPIKKRNLNSKVEKERNNEIIKHVDLLLSLNEELKQTQLPAKTQQIKQRIEHSEEKINQLVYELYELTEEEIKIIEESING
jgi:preprotein translocase subunit SecA